MPIMTKGPDSAEDLIRNLILGAEQACKQYLQMSGYPAPGVAPELFLHAGAARALRKFGSTWIVLEEPVLQTLKAAGATARGPHKKTMRSNGRYDIVLYWKSEAPRAAIEVKSPVNVDSKQRYEKDIDRLIDTMTRNPESTFQFASFLFLTVKRKKSSSYDFELASREIDNFVSKVLAEAVKGKIKKSRNSKLKLRIASSQTYKISGEKPGAWRISALSITR